MLNETKIDKQVNAIIDALEAIQSGRDFLKKIAMVYQYDLKCEIAAKLGINWEELNLPYDDWAQVRDWWFEGEQERIDKLQEEFWGVKIVRGNRGRVVSWK